MAIRIGSHHPNSHASARVWLFAALALVVATGATLVFHPVSFGMGDYGVEVGVTALPADLPYYGILNRDLPEIPNFSPEVHVRAVQFGRWRCGAVAVRVRNTNPGLQWLGGLNSAAHDQPLADG